MEPTEALKRAEAEKQAFLDMQANAKATEEADLREKLAQIKRKVETYLTKTNQSWMMEFLDQKIMSLGEYTFRLPNHIPVCLCFGGRYATGIWVLEKGSARERTYLSLGEALVKAEQPV